MHRTAIANTDFLVIISEPNRIHPQGEERAMSTIRHLAAALLALSASTAPLRASETIDYQYDAQGRVTKVVRAGAVNNGTTSCYSYDKTDNRSNVTVATPGDCAAGSPPPSFYILDASGTEGGSVVFTVVKTGAAQTSSSVNYATANGSATSTSDYFPLSGTLSFTAGETSKSIVVVTRANTTAEPLETFVVNLSGATGGATIPDAQGVGSIADDD